MARRNAVPPVTDRILRQLYYLTQRHGDGETAFAHLRAGLEDAYPAEIEALDTARRGTEEPDKTKYPLLTGWEQLVAGISRDNGGDALVALAHAQQARQRIRARAKGQWAALSVPLVYFAVVLVIGFATLFQYATVLIPAIRQISSGSTMGSPAVTAPDFIIAAFEPWLAVVLSTFVLAVVVVLIAALYSVKQRIEATRELAAWSIWVPGLRRVANAYYRALASEITDTLKRSGVPTEEALAIASGRQAASTGRADLLACVASHVSSVTPGEGWLERQLYEARQCGTADSEITYLAETALDTFEHSLIKLRAAFMPIAYLVVGACIGLLAILMYAPIFAGLGAA